MEGKEIVIRIVTENKEGGTPSEVEKITTPEKKSTNKIEQAAFTVLAANVAKNLKNIIVSEAEYQINRYLSLTDDYMAQQNMNIALNIAGKAATYAIAMTQGPLGVAYIVSDSIRTLQQVNHHYAEQNIQLAKMDAQLQFNRERAGYSLTAGSRGENR